MVERPGITSEEQLERWIVALNDVPLWRRRQYLRRQNAPCFLYKYRAVDTSELSIDRLHQIVVRSELWLSSPFDFNDPFDTGANLVVEGLPVELGTRIRELVESRMVGASEDEKEVKIAEMTSRSPDEMLKILRNGYERGRGEMGVYSFAGDPRSILMWSHYGKDHSGICLQFDVARDPRVLLRAIPVEYSDDYPHVNWVTGMADELRISLLRKYRGWAYEKERRIVIPNDARKRLRFRHDALTGIIVGCRAKDNIRTLARELILDRVRRGFSKPKLFEVVQHQSKYALQIARISV